MCYKYRFQTGLRWWPELATSAPTKHLTRIVMHLYYRSLMQWLFHCACWSVRARLAWYFLWVLSVLSELVRTVQQLHDMTSKPRFVQRVELVRFCSIARSLHLDNGEEADEARAVTMKRRTALGGLSDNASIHVFNQALVLLAHEGIFDRVFALKSVVSSCPWGWMR